MATETPSNTVGNPAQTPKSANNSPATATGHGTFHTKAHPPLAGGTQLVQNLINGTASAPGKRTNEQYRKDYEVMHIGIGLPEAPRYKTYLELLELAKKLNVKYTDVVWHAIHQVLKNPPSKVESSGNGPVGSASGFWVVAETDTTGKATQFRVVEVEERAQQTGILFLRYDEDNDKSRQRAYRQAQGAADRNRALAGIKAVPGNERTQFTTILRPVSV